MIAPRPPDGPRRTQLGVLRGVLLTARFRTDGMAYFGGGIQQVLGSLAPLLAFPAVFLVLLLLSGGRADDLAEVLSVIDALLLQLVLSEALARRWGREAEWGRYAAAFNWCQWAVPPVGMLMLLAVRVLVGAGLSPLLAGPFALLALAGYALALQWFVARHALRLTGGRAALLVLCVNASTAAVVILPTQLRVLLAAGA